MKNRTYKDFGEAIEELRQKARISYDTIAFKIRHPQSYVYGLCTKRKRNLPKYEQMKEFSDFFNVPEDYFYEYRLRKMLEFLDGNREFLDHCEKESRKFSKSPTPLEPEPKKETSKSKKEQNSIQPV